MEHSTNSKKTLSPTWCAFFLASITTFLPTSSCDHVVKEREEGDDTRAGFLKVTESGKYSVFFESENATSREFGKGALPSDRAERRTIKTASPSRVRTDCSCTSIDSYLSNGVDVRPRVGCEDHIGDGSDPYCYVVSTCDSSVASVAFPGAQYWTACSSPPPPPPQQEACSDPLFPDQWHLSSGRVRRAWSSLGGRGASIRISVIVVDDGVDPTHEDLPTLNESVHWTDEGRIDTTSPSPSGPHGTACAGIVASIADNGRGGCGVAPLSLLSSAALLQVETQFVFDTAEADSVDHFLLSGADVYSNSWGPPDDLASYTMGPYMDEALRRATSAGREGKGAVVLFAAGNGGSNDNANADPYAAHPSVIAVGAIGDDDRYTWYSEPGACILIVAPSGGGRRGITTTDVTGSGGYSSGDYTSSFSGTSAATPFAAGVVSLLLSFRPDLSWRDAREVIASTARKNDPLDAGWVRNGAGVWFHPYYGFGAIDAEAAIEAAEGWDLLENRSEERDVTVGWAGNETIDDSSGEPTTLFLVVDEENILLETVTLFVDIVHAWRGDLFVSLTSPSGTESVLTTTFSRLPGQDRDASEAASIPRTYLSHHFRLESGAGSWRVTVRDIRPGYAGDWPMDGHADPRSAIRKILGVDVGILNLGLCLVETDSDSYGWSRLVEWRHIDMTHMTHRRVPRLECKLPHTNCMADRIQHMLQEERDLFEDADVVLIEQQPICGHVAVEQLLFSALREKAHLVSPTAMQKRFHMRHLPYEERKAFASRFFHSSDSVPESTKAELAARERSHDVYDSFLIVQYWLTRAREALPCREVRVELDEIRPYSEFQTFDEYLAQYRFQ